MELGLRSEILESVEKGLHKLDSVWTEIGYDEQEKMSRWKQVKSHVSAMLEAMISEVESTKSEIVGNIEDLLKESAKLSAELGVKIAVDSHEYEMLPLCDVEKDIKRKVSEFRAIRQKRVLKYSELKTKEIELCECLGVEPLDEISNPVPTEEQLAEFEAYLDVKADEKAYLSTLFHETRMNIIKIMNDLEMTPILDLEKQIVCDDESSFKLSKENMTKLRELHQSLVQKLEDTKSLAMELREKLVRLWDRLYESFDVRSAFLDANSGYSVKTIEALKLEIQRCEERKRQNIKIFVEKIREEIHSYWEKCCFGEMQRRKFITYFSDCYTEDLLELHELEAEKLKTFYERNRTVFQLMEKRKRLWEKMVELESRASDTKRLFDNRGGQLLREEKERKTIQKELPKIEQQLCNLVKAYEEESGESFLFYDQRLSELIQEQWNEHQENKEMQKIARKAREIGSENKQPTKRKLGTTPSASALKLTQISSKSNSKVNQVSRNLFPLRSAATQNALGSQPTGNPSGIHDISMASTTYADFESHLDTVNNKDLCRSSLKRRCLRAHNETPVRPRNETAVCKSAPGASRAKFGFRQKGTGAFATPTTRRLQIPLRTPPSLLTNKSSRLVASQRGKLPIII